MIPTDDHRLDDVLDDGRRTLRAMDAVRPEHQDTMFYVQFAEELRKIVRDLVATHDRARTSRVVRVWLVWDCTDLVGVYESERAARTAQTDAQFELLCTIGPDVDLLETITVSSTVLNTSGSRRRWRGR